MENRKSVIATMALQYGMEAQAFEQTLRHTVVPQDCSKEQFAAFIVVANEYGLNPLTKEIYAFPSKSGGIQPIVSVDGWANLVNSHPQCDGFKLKENFDEKGNLLSVTAQIFRKDRAHAVEITEYLIECKRNTDVWKQWPIRMLRHKAFIQCARLAFGFAGIIDEDEAERIIDIIPVKNPPTPPFLQDNIAFDNEVSNDIFNEIDEAISTFKDVSELAEYQSSSNFIELFKQLNDEKKKEVSLLISSQAALISARA